MTKDRFKTISYEDKGIVWETFPDLCKSCGLCIEKCPVNALSFDLENNQYLGMSAVKCKAEICIACHTCEEVCPECAIKVTGKR